MRAVRWRAWLLGDHSVVHRLRSLPLPCPNQTRYDIQINLDMPRTPGADRDLLSRLLRTYADMHSGMGYVQGMNYVASTLLNVFCRSGEPDHAFHDAYFCFHAIMTKIRVFYPLNWRDKSPLKVTKATATLMCMHLEAELRRSLPEDFNSYLSLFLMRFWPCLFANMFDDPAVVWDFLIPDLRRNLFSLTTAMFLRHRVLLEHLSTLQLFSVIQSPHMHADLIKEARALCTRGMFPPL